MGPPLPVSSAMLAKVRFKLCWPIHFTSLSVISRLALTAGRVSMNVLPQSWHRQRRVST